MKRLFLFDLDGTLVSTGGAGMRPLPQPFRAHSGIAAPSSRVIPAGKTDPAIFRELIRAHLGRDSAPDELGQIAETYLSHLEREMSGSGSTARRMFAGVRE